MNKEQILFISNTHAFTWPLSHPFGLYADMPRPGTSSVKGKRDWKGEYNLESLSFETERFKRQTNSKGGTLYVSLDYKEWFKASDEEKTKIFNLATARQNEYKTY